MESSSQGNDDQHRDSSRGGPDQRPADEQHLESQHGPPSLEERLQEAQQGLKGQPRVFIRKRLSIGFLLWFLFSLGLAIVSIVIISDIKTKVVFMEAAANYTFEIQQARRFEKNYFLYRTNLTDALAHIFNAQMIMEKERPNIVKVVGPQDYRAMVGHLKRYRDLISQLVDLEKNSEKDAGHSRLNDIEHELRLYGAEMVAVAENVVSKERRAVNSMLNLSQRIPAVFLVVLLLLMIYLASFISKHVLLRLKRMVEYSRRIAEGDFTPIGAQRKYFDEFSELAMAMNHMMYQLEYRQELLMQAHKLKAIGTLTAGIAHELNNPLNNIILTASMLREDFNDLSRDECMELVGDLEVESERARKIVRNLLDFAREREADLESHSVREIIEKTLRLGSNQIKLAKVKAEVEIEDNVPSIYCDRQQLEQVFLNLIFNALDAMPEGGVLKISVLNARDRESVAVKFEDTGVGIPKHRLRDIFDPFYTSKRKAKGTGLGLSVSLGIVQKHGGDIRVESEFGKGSVFTVLLPIAKVPAKI